MGRTKAVDQHLSEVLSEVAPLVPLNFTIGDAHGCVAAADMVAARGVPAYDQAAVDGYAVQASDVVGATPDAPVKLSVVGEVGVGSEALEAIRTRQSVRVRQGSPIPAGADAVVPVGLTDGGLVTVQVRRSAEPWDGVRREGSEAAAGAPTIRRGDVLDAARIGVLAASGATRVLAHPRPRVVVLTLGAPDGRSNGSGPAALDVTGYALTAAVRECGANAYRVAEPLTGARDLATAVEDHLIRADVLVTAGGLAGLPTDPVRAAVDGLGQVSFDTVDMAPGGVLGFGFVGPERVPVFCLPGDVTAALVSLEILVRPVLRRLAAHEEVLRPRVTARAGTTIASTEGVREFLPVALVDEDGEWLARPLASAHGRISDLAGASGFLDIPDRVTRVAEGEAVTVVLTDEQLPSRRPVRGIPAPGRAGAVPVAQ